MKEKKNLYRNKILKLLYFEEALTCAEISDEIKKSFPFTNELLEDLVAKNEIIEIGFAASTGGRRAQAYSLQPNTMFVVSIAMDQIVTKMVIIDSKNNFITPINKIVLPLTNNPDAVQFLKDSVNAFIENSGIPKNKFVGIGIGMPGFINNKEGINYSFLKLPEEKSISKYIEETVGLPVFIDNDSSLIALAELRFGAAKNTTDAMIINVGWGIGLGMVLNSQLYRGFEGFAGEFSHIPLFPKGKLCWCGKIGCLETETSLLLIIEKARQGIASGRQTTIGHLPIEDPELAYESVLKAVHDGDQFAIELFSKAAFEIGKGVAILIHLLNPRKIILSGRGAAVGTIWLPSMQQALNEHCIRRLHQSSNLEISSLGKNAELFGGAALVMDNYEKIKSKNNQTSIHNLLKLN